MNHEWEKSTGTNEPLWEYFVCKNCGLKAGKITKSNTAWKTNTYYDLNKCRSLFLCDVENNIKEVDLNCNEYAIKSVIE